MTCFPRAAAVLLALLLPLTSGAQDSAILGTVRDARNHRPLPDVVVTATSPSLEKEQQALTDEEGEYRLPSLPPGVYTLRFEHPLYQSYTRAELPLRPGRSLRVNLTLVEQPIELVEPIGGCSDSVLDVTGSATGKTRADLMWAEDAYLASSPPSDSARALRSAEGLARWTPGVTEGLSVHDATPYENAYLLDGLSTRDAATGLDALPVSEEFLFSNRVLTAGHLPEDGRATGGILQLETPNGSEELSGSVFAHWAPGLLEGRREPVEDWSAPRHLGDVGATLSGPLARKRLRFFVGVTPALGRVEHTGPSGSSFTDSRSLQALGTLTLTPAHHHQVSLSVLTAPESLREPGATLERNTTRVALHQASTFGYPGLLLDVHAGWLGQRDSRELAPGAPTDEDGVIRERALDQYQARARLTWERSWASGYHRAQAGVDAEHFVHERTRVWADDTSGPGTLKARTPGTVLGGYVQDQWTLDYRMTVHGGLRYDVQLLSTGEAGRSTAAVPLLSPRVGVAFDPTWEQRAKLFVHYARNPGLVPVGLLDRATVEERVPVSGPSLIDPELEAMASHEVVTGAAYVLASHTQVSATYTHRTLDSGLASLRTDSRGSVVLVNPGSGLGASLPKAERTYDAVTLELFRAFCEGWMAHVSYTASWLRGNHAGPWEGVASASGPLPGDRRHVLRVHGVREVQLGHTLSVSGGLSYFGGSGTPVADGTSRTPWQHTVDARLILSWKLGKEETASFHLDAFNLLNSQASAQLEDSGSGLVPVRYPPPRQVRLGVRYRF